jgi:ATP-dependent helicase/nuclease subunit B
VQPHRPRLHGVGSVELYAQCPFKYFARHVLRLDEEPDDEEALTPRERGVFIHEVFQAFFAAWAGAGHGAITPSTVAEARSLLEQVMQPMLQRLTPADAALERARLLGSPVAAGLADLVLRMEAARPLPVLERRLEERFEGRFALAGAEGPQPVSIRGIVDRIDLLADGTLRVIDYKSSLLPQPMQLAVYAVTAAQRLRGHRGREWSVGEAAYIIFNAGRGVKPLGRKAEERARVLAEAQARFLEAVAGIEEGSFPPRPAQGHLCASCAFAGICRKDYVAQDDAPGAAAAV